MKAVGEMVLNWVGTSLYSEYPLPVERMVRSVEFGM